MSEKVAAAAVHALGKINEPDQAKVLGDLELFFKLASAKAKVRAELAAMRWASTSNVDVAGYVDLDAEGAGTGTTLVFVFSGRSTHVGATLYGTEGLMRLSTFTVPQCVEYWATHLRA